MLDDSILPRKVQLSIAVGFYLQFHDQKPLFFKLKFYFKSKHPFTWKFKANQRKLNEWHNRLFSDAIFSFCFFFNICIPRLWNSLMKHFVPMFSVDSNLYYLQSHNLHFYSIILWGFSFARFFDLWLCLWQSKANTSFFPLLSVLTITFLVSDTYIVTMLTQLL